MPPAAIALSREELYEKEQLQLHSGFRDCNRTFEVFVHKS